MSGEIEFRGVRFVYPLRPSVVIFNNFNLTVHPGHVTALVGESGSGKSTVVQLIERFYDPQAGAVLLDGVDVRQYNLRHLRSLVRGGRGPGLGYVLLIVHAQPRITACSCLIEA